MTVRVGGREQRAFARNSGAPGKASVAELTLFEDLESGSTRLDNGTASHPEHVEAILRPADARAVGRLADHGAAANPEEGSSAFGHHGRCSEAASDHDIDLMAHVRAPARDLSPFLVDLDTVPDTQDTDSVTEKGGSTPTRLDQQPVRRRKQEGQREARKPGTTP